MHELKWNPNTVSWSFPVALKGIAPIVPGSPYTSENTDPKITHCFPSYAALECIKEWFPYLHIPDYIEDTIPTIKHSLGVPRRYAWETTDLELKPHQRENVEFVKHAKRVIVADPVGLGKTITAIGTLNELHCVHKVMIVILPSLKRQWINELSKWAKDDYELYDCVSLPKKKRTYVFNQWYVTSQPSILLVNWEALRLLPDPPTMDVIIADEAHKAKNRKAQTTIALKKFAAKSEYVLCMTGTPMSKSVADFWSLLNIMYPTIFRSYWRFFYAFVDFEADYFDNIKVLGNNRNSLPVIKEIQAGCYRRTEQKKDFEVVYQTVPYKLHSSVYRLQKAIKDTGYIKELDLEVASGIVKLTRCRQIIGQPQIIDPSIKHNTTLATLIDLLDTIPEDDQVLILTSFVANAELISETIPKCRMFVAKDPNKQTVLDDFSNKKFSILTATTDSLGTGHNLQNANILMFYDLPLSHRQYIQAIGRIDRLGQTKQPVVYKLVAENSAAHTVDALLQAGDTSFNEVVIAHKFLTG